MRLLFTRNILSGPNCPNYSASNKISLNSLYRQCTYHNKEAGIIQTSFRAAHNFTKYPTIKLASEAINFGKVLPSEIIREALLNIKHGNKKVNALITICLEKVSEWVSINMNMDMALC